MVCHPRHLGSNIELVKENVSTSASHAYINNKGPAKLSLDIWCCRTHARMDLLFLQERSDSSLIVCFCTCFICVIPVSFYNAEAFPRSTIAAVDYVSHRPRSTTNRLSAFSATLRINYNVRFIAS
jgi:hypothetical protein